MLVQIVDPSGKGKIDFNTFRYVFLIVPDAIGIENSLLLFSDNSFIHSFIGYKYQR